VKKTIISNSCVIVAKSHNPTLLSSDFLIRIGIVKSIDEVDLSSLIITPPLSQVLLTNGYILSIDLDRFKVEGKEGIFPFLCGNYYLKALPHIKCRAIGLNFRFELTEYNFQKWFDRFIIDNLLAPQSVNYQIRNETYVCNIDIIKQKKESCRINFNFHYEFDETIFETIISILNMEDERISNLSMIDDIINKLFV